MKVKLAGNNGTRVPGYGALELKASYQKNLGLAILISSTLFFILVAFLSSFSTKTPKRLQKLDVVIPDTIIIMPPPPMTNPVKPKTPIDPTQILA